MIKIAPIVWLIYCNLICNCWTFAQVGFKDAIIVSDKLNNLAYLNVSNPFTVYTDKQIISLQTDNGNVFEFDEKIFVAPIREGYCNLVILFADSLSMEYTLRVISHPVLPRTTIVKSHSLTFEKLSEVQRLGVFWEVDYEYTLSMVSFTLEAFKDDILVYSNHNQGSIFDSNTQEILDQYENFDKIVFKDVLVKFENGNTMYAQNLEIVHK